MIVAEGTRKARKRKPFCSCKAPRKQRDVGERLGVHHVSLGEKQSSLFVSGPQAEGAEGQGKSLWNAQEWRAQPEGGRRTSPRNQPLPPSLRGDAAGRQCRVVPATPIYSDGTRLPGSAGRLAAAGLSHQGESNRQGQKQSALLELVPGSVDSCSHGSKKREATPSSSPQTFLHRALMQTLVTVLYLQHHDRQKCVHPICELSPAISH